MLATVRLRVSVKKQGEEESEKAWYGLFQDVMIEMLDHTADVGFWLRAPTLEGLFEEARRALLMIMFERPPGEGGEGAEIQLSARDLDTLLVRWLNELTYLVQDAGFVPVGAELRIHRSDRLHLSLEASLTGAPLLLEDYGWQGEIKSATFHGLDVANDQEGWRARVILDV